jgi:hypothetical protein
MAPTCRAKYKALGKGYTGIMADEPDCAAKGSRVCPAKPRHLREDCLQHVLMLKRIILRFPLKHRSKAILMRLEANLRGYACSPPDTALLRCRIIPRLSACKKIVTNYCI